MNSQLDPQNEIHELAHQTFEESAAQHAGWPGDGSGMDDFADYNRDEANDYTNEWRLIQGLTFSLKKDIL